MHNCDRYVSINCLLGARVSWQPILAETLYPYDNWDFDHRQPSMQTYIFITIVLPHGILLGSGVHRLTFTQERSHHRSQLSTFNNRRFL